MASRPNKFQSFKIHPELQDPTNSLFQAAGQKRKAEEKAQVQDAKRRKAEPKKNQQVMASSTEDMMKLSDDRLTLIKVSNSAIKDGTLTIPNSVTQIRYYAFVGCTNLTSIPIPNSVKQIGDYAFDGCTSLTSITIPNSVTQIGNYAFYYCKSLTSITIPNSVVHIGEGAFYGCTSLISITIPNSVTQISGYTFRDCTNLTSITIPNSVTQIIANGALHGCTSLTNIIIDSDDDAVIARITALLSEELRDKVITEHQVAKKFNPENNYPKLSLFWLAAKAASKLDTTNAEIPQGCAEAIEAARPFA